MIREFKAEGIVLSEFKYKEKSKIIRVFTKELGKISIMARGALGAKSNLVAVSQMFSVNEYELFKGNSFYYIKNANIVKSNFNIRNSYDRLVYGSFLLELYDRTFPEGEVNENAYLLLKKTLSILENMEKNILNLILAFEIKFISFLGYRPVLKYEFKNPSFSLKNGGVVEKVPLGDYLTYDISNEDIYYLSNLLYTSLDALNIDIDEQRLLYLQKIIIEYIKFNLEIDEFKSLKLI